MPIRMVDDEPGGNSSKKSNKSNSNQGRQSFSGGGVGGGLGNILGSFLPYLLKNHSL